MTTRRLKIALAASLAGNLFLLGLLGGMSLLGERKREHGPEGGRFAAVAEKLDPEDAEALRTLMRLRAETAKPRVEALRASRRAVEASLGRPDYDPEQVRAALAQARVQERALREELDAALIEFAAGLEPEERAAIAPLLRKGLRGWKGDRRDDERSRDGAR